MCACARVGPVSEHNVAMRLTCALRWWLRLQYPEPCLIHMTNIMCLRSIALAWDSVILLAKFESDAESSKNSWNMFSNARSPTTAFSAVGAFTIISSSAGGEAAEEEVQEASWNLSVLNHLDHSVLFNEIMGKAEVGGACEPSSFDDEFELTALHCIA
jgi:hypothetical protein